MGYWVSGEEWDSLRMAIAWNIYKMAYGRFALEFAWRKWRTEMRYEINDTQHFPPVSTDQIDRYPN